MSGRRILCSLFISAVFLAFSVEAQEAPAGKANNTRLIAEENPPAWLAVLSHQIGLANAGRAQNPIVLRESLSSFAVSPDCRHVAYAVRSSAGARVVVDGEAQQSYEAVLQDTMVFSPDGRRLGYGAKKEGKSLVVLDGKESRLYDAVLRKTLVFSSDSKRAAYGVEEEGKAFVVVDGKEERAYDAILEGTLLFSPDGKQLVYGVKTGGKAAVVLNGTAGKHYDAILEGTLRFSPGGRLAYAAEAGGKAFVVAYGREEEKYDRILKGTPVFSPDGKRIAYGAMSGRRKFIVVDGKAGKDYQYIEPASLVFSPDGARLAYVAGAGKKRLVVADGEEGPECDKVLINPVFSQDGNRLVYGVKNGGKAFVIIEGKAEKQYDDLAPGSLVISPDGKRLAYAARTGGRWFAVLDGREGAAYDYVSALTFSPDGRQLAYVASQGGRAFVVVEGREEPRYDGILTAAGGRIVYVSDTLFHYLAMDGRRIYLAGNYPQLPEDPELERAIEALRHVDLEKLDEVGRWHRTEEIAAADAVVFSRGEAGLLRIGLELARIAAANEKDDYFRLCAASLLWRLGRLEQAEVIAEIWRGVSLKANYESVFYTAHEAALTRDPRVLPMLRAAMNEAEGRVYLGDYALDLTWPMTQEYIWGAYGPAGLEVLTETLPQMTSPKEIQAALLILGKGTYAPALPLIRKYAADQRVEVRGIALLSLGMFGHPQDYETLLGRLGREIGDDVIYRLYALAEYGDLRAVPVILGLLGKKDNSLSQARLTAISVLPTLLTTDALGTLRRMAKSSKNEAERVACAEFLQSFLGQTGLTWEEYDKRPRDWQRGLMTAFRNRHLLLQAGERVLTRAEFLEVVAEWNRSKSMSNSGCAWVQLAQILPVANAADLDLLRETKAGFYSRVSLASLVDISAIDKLLRHLERSRYRKDPGITDRVEAG